MNEEIAAYLKSTAGQTTTPVPLDLARFRDPEPVTALAAAPGTAPGGGAQEAATPGQAARKAWGDHWDIASERGRGKPGWDSRACEAEAWEVAAAAAWAPERDRLNAALAENERLRFGLRAVLREHYLMQVVCNPETKQDNPVCQCSRVNLGWHPSVGAAVEAWIDHVLLEARDA